MGRATIKITMGPKVQKKWPTMQYLSSVHLQRIERERERERERDDKTGEAPKAVPVTIGYVVFTIYAVTKSNGVLPW